MRRRFPLHVHITTVFLFFVLLVGGLISGLAYKFSSDLMEKVSDDLNTRVSRETLGELRRLIEPVGMAVHLLALDEIGALSTPGQRAVRLSVMRETLDRSYALASIYIGYEDGDFYFVRKLRNEAERLFFKGPEEARYLVQSIERTGANARGRYTFLDDELRVLREDERPDYAASYDPRERGWFRAGSQSPDVVMTAPYVFFSNQKVGTTLAKRAPHGGSVVGADILLETLSSSLARQKVTPNSQMALVDSGGFVIAHEEVSRLTRVAGAPAAPAAPAATAPATPPAAPASPAPPAPPAPPAGSAPGLTLLSDFGVPVLSYLAIQLADSGGRFMPLGKVRISGDDWRTSITPITLEGAQPLYLVSAVPDRELLSAAFELRGAAILVVGVLMLLMIPITWYLARGIARSLRGLLGEAEAIRRFDFARPSAASSYVTEVYELGETMDGMKQAIRRFLDISMAVAAEDNFDRLLPHLLVETLSAANATVGVLYLADEDTLRPMAVHLENDVVSASSLPNLPFDAPFEAMREAVAKGKPQLGRLVDSDLRALGLRAWVREGRLECAIVLPLLNRQHQLVGLMLLLSDTPIDAARLSFVTALAGSVTVSLESKLLIQAQKALFESFIRLIAGAIDSKSPYTGGHCERVPELTKMLARAACAETHGPWASFRLNEAEWEAVHIATWLHDCGKITTPEYIVDKATKLETIYDRIHEVRMRFEVIKRDAEIASLKALLAGEDGGQLEAKLAAELAQLDEEFAFVASCNQGGEFLGDSEIARLRQIGARRWLRTLDDRIGISHEERKRKSETASAALPVEESLLADKPDHRFPRTGRDAEAAAEDNPWGFRMDVPELLYNRGELYNLSVSRGTLTAEDRYKINEHIVQTIIMLSRLPYPRHLRSVPEIAGGHHETMDGRGYPKRLTGDVMSPVARMVAIADVFEALTAWDRPYKKGKTLSEALNIMSRMVSEHHLDADLFVLFLRSGVVFEYADRFVRAEQRDAVDIETYLAAARTVNH